jgi:integrase
MDRDLMQAMPRPRPPYLQRHVTRHGKEAWYVRVGRGPLIRIRGNYGSPEFVASYNAAVAGQRQAPAPAKDKRSLAWLIERYRESAAWASLKQSTRRQREAIFRQVEKASGDKPFVAIRREHIVAGLDRRRATPNQANHVLKTMRGLFQWAAKAQHVETDPTAGVEPVKTRTEGHRTWTAGDVEKFEARWPIGTRQRLAYTILAYTGLRRGDAVHLGRQHVQRIVVSGDDGRPRDIEVFALTLEKTGERVTIPIAPALAEVIAATPSGGMTYLETAYGRAMTSAGFGNWFREACDKAKVPGTAHGLRKALATRAAERGASEMELAALFGWRGIGTSSIYTRAARRGQLAAQAIEKALSGAKGEHPMLLPCAVAASTAGKVKKKQ